MLKNIIKNFLNPAYAPAMAHKIKMRLFNQSVDAKAEAESLAWWRKMAEDPAPLAGRLDAALWQESQSFADELKLHAQKTFEKFHLDLGEGGGNYALLYFLTRYLKPDVIVETGVAAGYSSKAFLQALQKNDRGRLYSSDFPLFRRENPERWIGVLVDEKLKARWELHITGDRKSLPEIVEKLERVDLFHYDSDKTYSGREFAMALLQKSLTAKSVIVMDDIQDNLFFRDYVQQRGCAYRVFEFEGKYQGVLGLEQ